MLSQTDHPDLLGVKSAIRVVRCPICICLNYFPILGFEGKLRLNRPFMSDWSQNPYGAAIHEYSDCFVVYFATWLTCGLTWPFCLVDIYYFLVFRLVTYITSVPILNDRLL